ncbi:MAG: ABC transporter ATP-binding protein [Bacteroidetes bacterium]|nr:ABC transporter ATP-binding protein [Bacteroidota bacterium]
MNSLAISIEDISFAYKGQEKKCLEHISLGIEAGKGFGLFGPNGAGKTTLMNCMTGLLSPQQGKISLFGNEVKKHDKAINHFFGFVPQDFSFYHELSPIENLEFFGAWYGLSKTEIKKRTEELLQILGLKESANKQVKKFSGGMKRRVNLAIGVMNNPKILFLDEPTVGVDVQTKHAIINYLKGLNSSGTTLVYTSHQLQEAEELCDDIAMIDEGKIIARDSLSNMMQQHNEKGLEGLFLHLTGKEFRD